jgi:hypothetical protein
MFKNFNHPTIPVPSNLVEQYAKRNIRGRSIISIVIGISAFFLFLYFYRYAMFLPVSFSVGYRTIPINWGPLGSMASAIGIAVAAGSVVFALREYIYSEKQRIREDAESAINMYKNIYDRLMNPDSVEARRWVILSLPTQDEMKDYQKSQDAWLAEIRKRMLRRPRNSKDKRAPGQEYVKHILNDLDFVGFIHLNYWPMDEEMAQWMSPPVAKVWERIEDYVEMEAKLRNEPDYYIAARKFGKYCLEWRKANRPKSNVIENGT